MPLQLPFSIYASFFLFNPFSTEEVDKLLYNAHLTHLPLGPSSRTTTVVTLLLYCMLSKASFKRVNYLHALCRAVFSWNKEAQVLSASPCWQSHIYQLGCSSCGDMTSVWVQVHSGLCTCPDVILEAAAVSIQLLCPNRQQYNCQ